MRPPWWLAMFPDWHAYHSTESSGGFAQCTVGLVSCCRCSVGNPHRSKVSLSQYWLSYVESSDQEDILLENESSLCAGRNPQALYFYRVGGEIY